jgi:glycosyltransferase involved in cell wall biosynthesis
MKISFINQSMEGYGADASMRYYYQESIKRGYESCFNIVDPSVDFYVIGMHYRPMETELKKTLTPHNFVYIEHSLECILPEKAWIRDWLMPNSLKNFFFSPRHRVHIEAAFPHDYKHLARENYKYITVPIDYEFFYDDPTIERRDNLFLFVGFIHPNKGIDTILNIANNNPDNEYWFIGTNEGSGASDVSIFDGYSNVQYLGHKNKNELFEYYNMAKGCFLLPANGAVESAGRVVFEAALCGCNPIVNSDVGNASYEWFKDPKKIVENIQKTTDALFNTITGYYEKKKSQLVSICMITIKTKEEMQKNIDDALNNAISNHEFIFVSNPDGGVAENRNKCLAQAKGNYVIFVDDDLFNYPHGWDEQLLHKLYEDKNVLMTGPRLLNTDNTFQKTVSHCDDIETDYVKVDYLPGACMVYRRDGIQFNEEYTGWGMEDIEFELMLKKINPSGHFLLCNKVKINHVNEMKNEPNHGSENKRKFYKKWGFMVE